MRLNLRNEPRTIADLLPAAQLDAYQQFGVAAHHVLTTDQPVDQHIEQLRAAIGALLTIAPPAVRDALVAIDPPRTRTDATNAAGTLQHYLNHCSSSPTDAVAESRAELDRAIHDAVTAIRTHLGVG